MNDLISNKIQIETETVSTKDGKRTYSITRRIVGMDESRAVMVMLYPTRSALKMNVDDSTFFHLTQHLPEMGISELTVINLFSKVCRARMSTANLKVDEENMRFIEDTIMKRKDFKSIPFIVAWGSSMQNCKSANESKVRLLKLFRKYNPKGIPQQLTCSYDKLKNESAPHPLFLGIRARNSKWSLCDFKQSKNTEVKIK